MVKGISFHKIQFALPRKMGAKKLGESFSQDIYIYICPFAIRDKLELSSYFVVHTLKKTKYTIKTRCRGWNIYVWSLWEMGSCIIKTYINTYICNQKKETYI